MAPAQHVVLGSGGAIAHSLVPALAAAGREVLLLSRRGAGTAAAAGLQVDILDGDALHAAVSEGSVMYLLAGFRYDRRVWREAWPRAIHNAIEVAVAKQALLVFFDNVYMYGPVSGPMTENTPYRPTTHKGAIRARVAEALQSEMSAGRVRGVIARAADFYGPAADSNGVPNLLVVARQVAGARAQWLVDADRAHSFTFTGDCGPALLLLADNPDSHNQVWHLPTAAPPLTGRERCAPRGQRARGVDAPSGRSVR